MPGTISTTEPTTAARERRLRAAAQRQGLRLVKSRSRTPDAAEHGGWMIVDPATNAVIAGGLPWAFSLSMADVEDYLAR